MKSIINWLSLMWDSIQRAFFGKEAPPEIKEAREIVPPVPAAAISQEAIDSVTEFGGDAPDIEPLPDGERIAMDIEDHASLYEGSQVEFMVLVTREGAAKVADALERYVDWEEVYEGYSMKMLNLIISRGTNMQFNAAHAAFSRQAAINERARRLAKNPRPRGHGMTVSGTQG